MKRKSELESGQAIIIIALLIVALVGMLGLAIDGGGLYFLRRDAQNAADAAVVAATYARCTGRGDEVTVIEPSVTAAGIAAARANNFWVGDGRTTQVEVDNPLLTTSSSPAASKTLAERRNYIEVTITATKPSYFIQVVYQGPLQVTIHAIGYCVPPFDPRTLSGLVGLGNDCPSGNINWSGADGTYSGGMSTNGQLQTTGNNINVYGDSSQGLPPPVGGSANWYQGTYENPGAPTSPTTNAPPINDPFNFTIDQFAPGTTVAIAVGSTYYHDVSAGSGAYTNPDLMEGLYYAKGRDVSLDRNNFPLVGDPSAALWQGVTVVTDGQITVNTQSGGRIIKYFQGIKNLVGGIVFLTTGQPPNNQCGNTFVDIRGSDVVWTGYIYAPKAKVTFAEARAQGTGGIMAYMVNMSGSNMFFEYDPTLLPGRSPTVQMAE